MIQIIFCLLSIQLALTHASNFSALGDELSHIFQYVPTQEGKGLFRLTNRPCDNTFTQHSKIAMDSIHKLQGLLRVLEKESLSHNQTNEIIRSISEIHHDRSVMLNELYLLKLPHVIRTWHRKMRTIHNGTSRDYKIRRIKQTFHLMPIEHDVSINRNFYQELDQSTHVLIALSRKMSMCLMLCRSITRVLKHSQIRFLQFMYQFVWEAIPTLPPLDSIGQLSKSESDHLMKLTVNAGLIIFHPKYIASDWSGISLKKLTQLISPVPTSSITSTFKYSLPPHLLINLDIKCFIKMLQSTNRIALHKFIHSQTQDAEIFTRLLLYVVQILCHRNAESSRDMVMFELLFSELKRNDALGSASILHLVDFNAVLVDMERIC